MFAERCVCRFYPSVIDVAVSARRQQPPPLQDQRVALLLAEVVAAEEELIIPLLFAPQLLRPRELRLAFYWLPLPSALLLVLVYTRVLLVLLLRAVPMTLPHCYPLPVHPPDVSE